MHLSLRLTRIPARIGRRAPVGQDVTECRRRMYWPGSRLLQPI